MVFGFSLFCRTLRKNYFLVGWPHKGAQHPREIFDSDIIHRLVGQVEVCKTTNKDHYQIFVQFITKKRPTAVHKIFPSGQWSTQAQKYGSAVDMEAYCSKEDTRKIGEEPFFLGQSLVVERKSSKLANAIEALKGGMSLRQVALDHSEAWVRHSRGLTDLHSKIISVIHKPSFTLSSFKWPAITDWSKTQIFWGLPGIGKSEFALAHFSAPLVVSHIDDLRQFDQTVHDGIVFDDMDFAHIPRAAQIHLCDQTLPRSLHIRYATALIPAHTHKIFTTNNPDGVIFKDQQGDKAITRRIHVTQLLGLGYSQAQNAQEESSISTPLSAKAHAAAQNSSSINSTP